MIRRVLSLVVVLAAACSRGAAPPPGGPPGGPAATADPDAPLPSPLPDIVARVNGQPIGAVQIVPLAKRRLEASRDQGRDQPRALREALEEFIDRELLFQEALARGVKAEDRVVEHVYDRMRADHPDEAKWTAYLAAQGLDPRSLRSEIRVQETINELLRSLAEGGAETGRGVRDALVAKLRARARIETYL